MIGTKTQTAAPLTCTTPTPAGFTLPCPACGEVRANFGINLIALDEANAFACQECDAEFSFDFLRKLVNVWSRVLPAVAAMASSIDADAIGDDGLPAEAAE